MNYGLMNLKRKLWIDNLSLTFSLLMISSVMLFIPKWILLLVIFIWLKIKILLKDLFWVMLLNFLFLHLLLTLHTCINLRNIIKSLSYHPVVSDTEKWLLSFRCFLTENIENFFVYSCSCNFVWKRQLYNNYFSVY